MKVTVKRRYLTIFVLVLVTEVAIAVFHFHRFVRGFLGDVLVIPLLYTLLRTFLSIPRKRTLYGVLCFAFLIEILQLFRLGERLGIASEILLIIIGSVFDPLDLVAYAFGFMSVLYLESQFNLE